MENQNIYKFTDTNYTFEQVSETKAAKLRSKIDNNEKITREEKNWITESVMSNMYSKWGIPVVGWMISFRDVLKRYVVRFSYDSYWTEIHAIDKTSIRNLYKSIEEIVEISKKN